MTVSSVKDFGMWMSVTVHTNSPADTSRRDSGRNILKEMMARAKQAKLPQKEKSSTNFNLVYNGVIDVLDKEGAKFASNALKAGTNFVELTRNILWKVNMIMKLHPHYCLNGCSLDSWFGTAQSSIIYKDSILLSMLLDDRTATHIGCTRFPYDPFIV